MNISTKFNNKMKITDNHKIKTSQLMSDLKKQVSVYYYWNDEELDKDFPQPKETTTRYFKDEKEPEMLGKSWNEIHAEVGDQMMTMREYIIAFGQYFKETGKYLDEKGWTLFRDELPGDKKVATGCWYVDYAQALFYWRYRLSCLPDMGGRVAISLESSTLATSMRTLT